MSTRSSTRPPARSAQDARQPVGAAPLIVSILGLCPKCDGWFPCDDFFDGTVAMPCCPQCQLAPAKVDYRFPAATKAVEVAEVVAAAAGAPAEQSDAAAQSEAVGLAHDVLGPPVLDTGIPGVDLGVATRPAGALFGGTYGAYPSTEGEWAVLLADVAGHDHDAAAQTEVVRNSVHGLAKAVGGPGLMLSLLNQLLIEEPTTDRLCSAVMVRLHTASLHNESLRATVARAGHPYPLVLKADGRVQVVRPEGMLLGVATALSFDTETVVLEPGDALVLYTDGVLEGWDRNPSRATVQLIDELEDIPHGSAEQMARHLLGVPTDGDQPGRDAAAVLVVKAAEVPAEGTAAPSRSTGQQGGATAGIDHPENSTATVITVDGALDAESMARLLDMLAAQYVDGDVAIDLSGVTMTSPSAVRGLVARLSAWGDTATLRIVCDRLAPRRLLRKWGGTSLPLASTMTAALASLASPRVRRQ